jgi:hypothetical protein
LYANVGYDSFSPGLGFSTEGEASEAVARRLTIKLDRMVLASIGLSISDVAAVAAVENAAHKAITAE